MKLVCIFESGLVGVTVLASFSYPSAGHQVGESVGGGSGSKGKRRASKSELTEVVVKRVNSDDPEPENLDWMKRNDIPHTVHMFCHYKKSGRYKYIVLEYVPDGNLTSHSNRLAGTMQRENGRKGFSEPLVRHWMTFVVVFLERIQSHNVSYGDLKPDNLLLTPEGGIKVGVCSILGSERCMTLCSLPCRQSTLER